MEIDTLQDTPVGLLGDLLPTYQSAAESLNRVRRMMWAWDYVRARETIAALLDEYAEPLSNAKEVTAALDAESKDGTAQARLIESSDGPEEEVPIETSDFRKLLDARSHALPASEVPAFVFSGLAEELSRLDQRLHRLDAAEVLPVATEVGGFRYLFALRPGARVEVRAYRDTRLDLTPDFALERLGKVADASLITDEEAEGVLAFRLSFDSALLDLRIIGGDSIQGILYPIGDVGQPSDYFDDVIGTLSAPEPPELLS